jgi:hypothetical protein
VELSNVDEGALEAAVNAWVGQGWRLENVQFAMRESSRRPSMAFVFFTRPGRAAPARPQEGGEGAGGGGEGEGGDPEAARRRLVRLSEEGPTAHVARGAPAGGGRPPPVSAWERLRQLAEGGEEPDGGDGEA